MEQSVGRLDPAAEPPAAVQADAAVARHLDEYRRAILDRDFVTAALLRECLSRIAQRSCQITGTQWSQLAASDLDFKKRAGFEVLARRAGDGGLTAAATACSPSDSAEERWWWEAAKPPDSESLRSRRIWHRVLMGLGFSSLAFCLELLRRSLGIGAETGALTVIATALVAAVLTPASLAAGFSRAVDKLLVRGTAFGERLGIRVAAAFVLLLPAFLFLRIGSVAEWIAAFPVNDYHRLSLAIRLDPDCRLAYFKRGELFADHSDWEKAKADYLSALSVRSELGANQVSPGADFFILTALARLTVVAGKDLQVGLLWSRAATDRAPEGAGERLDRIRTDARLTLVWLYLLNGRYDEAWGEASDLSGSFSLTRGEKARLACLRARILFEWDEKRPGFLTSEHRNEALACLQDCRNWEGNLGDTTEARARFSLLRRAVGVGAGLQTELPE